MFPVDTIKTTMQVRQGSQVAVAGPSMLASFEHLTASGGVPRMWRGVQTMFTGCVPAHAAYFKYFAPGQKAAPEGKDAAPVAISTAA